MERKVRQEISFLIDFLSKNAKKFSFIQALRLIKLIINEEEDKFFENKIQVKPKLSLDFPETDIVNIEPIEEDFLKFNITVTFLGLYGSSSPLPSFYTEDLLEERRNDKSIMRDFLNIINMPLYSNFFKIWSKYQLPYKFFEEKDDEYINRCYNLIGLGELEFRKRLKYAHLLLRYIELITQFPRSAESLSLILKDILSIKYVDIIQCVKQKLFISEDQKSKLGVKGNKLSENCVIGTYIQDRMGKFRIVIKLADKNILKDFLPDGENFQKLKEIVNFYLASPLKWDLKLIIEQEIIETTCLGNSGWNRLGWNTWIFSGKFPKKEGFTLLSPINSNYYS